MPDRRRIVFFVSDGTGITVETLGHSLLTQFDGIDFDQMTVPFIDSAAKAEACVARINEAARSGAARPVVFTTLVNSEMREALRKADAFVMDFFESFLDPLEAEFGAKSTHTIGRSHSARDKKGYTHRIEAINFALAHDAEDFDRMSLPRVLEGYHGKLYGLSIAPERLREIRNERRPNSKYADLENCRHEVLQAEKLMQREGIRWANSTTKSIEEIATTILQEFKLERRAY